jgi:hypothetical protein
MECVLEACPLYYRTARGSIRGRRPFGQQLHSDEVVGNADAAPNHIRSVRAPAAVIDVPLTFVTLKLQTVASALGIVP